MLSFLLLNISHHSPDGKRLKCRSTSESHHFTRPGHLVFVNKWCSLRPSLLGMPHFNDLCSMDKYNYLQHSTHKTYLGSSLLLHNFSRSFLASHFCLLTSTLYFFFKNLVTVDWSSAFLKLTLILLIVLQLKKNLVAHSFVAQSFIFLSAVLSDRKMYTAWTS